MEHKIEIFNFKDVTGNDVKVSSKPYNFKLEKILTNRFGLDILKSFSNDGTFDSEVNLSAVTEDFPKLLKLDDLQINWEDQDFDEIERVYLFFVQYKRNAKLRALKSQEEILRLNMEGLTEMLNSIPKTIFQKTNENVSEFTS